MDGSVPKEVLQYTDSDTTALHKGVAQDSTRAGHPVSPVEVNPNDNSELENIKDILGKTAVHVVHSVSGEGSIHIDTTPGPRGLSLLKSRGRKLLKKAA